MFFIYMPYLIELFLYGNNAYFRDQYVYGILPACATATAHTFAFEFDPMRGVIAIFSNKQAEVSTGEKTYDATVYKVWKHVTW